MACWGAAVPQGQCLPSQLAQRTHRGDGMVAASGRKPPGLGCGHRSTPRCLKLSLCPQNASFQPVPCCWKGHCCSGCCLCPGGAGGTPWCRRGGSGPCSWPDPSAEFPTSPYGVQSAGNPAAGGGRSHPLRQGARGGRRCQVAGVGVPGGWHSCCPPHTPKGHPGVPAGHPQDAGAGHVGSKPGLPGQGGGSQPPLKPP